MYVSFILAELSWLKMTFWKGILRVSFLNGFKKPALNLLSDWTYLDVCGTVEAVVLSQITLTKGNVLKTKINRNIIICYNF